MSTVNLEKSISVLIPSRKRSDELLRSIRSIENTCEDPSRVEILIRLDTDDTDTITMVRDSNFMVDTTVIIDSRPPLGYIQINEMYHQLAIQSHGTYLFVFNDDSVIVSKNWDRIIASYASSPKILFTIRDGTRDTEFPIVHRRIVETLGIFARTSSVDRYFQLLGDASGILIHEPNIHVSHIRVPGRPLEHDRDGYPPFDPTAIYNMQADIASDVAHLTKNLLSQ